jgi:hypothetical protein
MTSPLPSLHLATRARSALLLLSAALLSSHVLHRPTPPARRSQSLPQSHRRPNRLLKPPSRRASMANSARVTLRCVNLSRQLFLFTMHLSFPSLIQALELLSTQQDIQFRSKLGTLEPAKVCGTFVLLSPFCPAVIMSLHSAPPAKICSARLWAHLSLMKDVNMASYKGRFALGDNIFIVVISQLLLAS